MILFLFFPGSEMPQSLKDKSTAVVEAGGVTELAKMIEELPDLLQRNKEILDEADRMLREERESDDQVSQCFLNPVMNSLIICWLF